MKIRAVPSVSIIATAYNQLPYIRLLLASLERQTFRDFEVIMADDGSSDGTAEFCKEPRSFPLLFVTQPDEGYRKARILNEALSRASAEYLLFVDSDVVLHPRFVEDHMELRKPESFVCGRRVDLGPVFSGELSAARLARLSAFHPAMLLSALRGDTENWKRGLRVPLPAFRRLLRYDRPLDILGSNFSAWKKDILEINGFNEALESYWGEDGDLFIRLRNSGKKAIGAKGLCVQYHVFHKRRPPTEENVAMVTKMLANTEYKRAERGYDSRFGDATRR